MGNRASTNRAQPILWITLVALLLVAMTSQVEVRTCLGACGDIAAVESMSCCASTDDTSADDTLADDTLADDAQPAQSDNECCGCCDDGEAPTDPSDEEEDGCCLTIDFDVDQAPNVTPFQLPPAAPVVCWVAPTWSAEVRVLEAPRGHGFDRGPPRTDQGAALRATQVLLI